MSAAKRILIGAALCCMLPACATASENAQPAIVLKPDTLRQPAQAAAERQILTWRLVPGAVSYEVELLAALPENPNGTEPSKQRIRAVRNIYAQGSQVDFSDCNAPVVYWRVRGLSVNGQPIGVYSDVRGLHPAHGRIAVSRPLPTVRFDAERQAPLYPVYAWLPVVGAYRYEVEVLDQAPDADELDSIAPSRHRIWSKRVEGQDCYDEIARSRPGTYYWRVRGLDAIGGPVGAYSEPMMFRVAHDEPVYAATLGDSITHGGGDVSYSPADPEYCYQNYLAIPTVNLGRSGDTARQILNRFEADVVPYHPKYLIILAGTNSLRDGATAETVIRELKALRDKCNNWAIRPIFLTLPPLNPPLIAQVSEGKTAANWRAEYDKVNRFLRAEPYCIDIAPALSDERGWLPEEYAVDGLHPGIEGKKIIAQLINENWARVTK